MYYYKQVKRGAIVSVESKSRQAISPDFVEATKLEYDSFIASLPLVEPEPVMNIEAEILGLKAEIKKLKESKST